MKFKTLTKLVLILIMPAYLFGWFCADYTCTFFINQCVNSTSGIESLTDSKPLLGKLIPEAGIHFYESSSYFCKFLMEAEKAEISSANFPRLKFLIEKAILSIESACCKYGDILKISDNLEMDWLAMEKLNKFDYEALQSKYNLNQTIYQKAASMCQMGVRGIYLEMSDTFKTIHEKLILIGENLEQKTIPQSQIWEVGQLYSQSAMYSQYVSMIFYEINKGVIRD